MSDAVLYGEPWDPLARRLLQREVQAHIHALRHRLKEADAQDVRRAAILQLDDHLRVALDPSSSDH